MPLPAYLNQTEAQILQRMLAVLPSDLDKAEGSYIWDALAPGSIEFNEISNVIRQLFADGFASTAASQVPGFRSEWLDRRVEEHGITRRAAVKASKENGVKFEGVAGTVVPVGTGVATPADAVTVSPSVEFVTTKAVTLDVNGIGYADIEAVEAGTSGNVPAGAITIIATPVIGLSSVTNLDPISGAEDIEDDQTLLARYLQRVRNPSSSGNRADYVAWALEVAGVGGVSVIPVRDGAGTVSIAIINLDKAPASQALIDLTQNHIAPPLVETVEAEDMTVGGSGTSIDNSQADDHGDSVKMEYIVDGPGTIVHALTVAILSQPGIWQARTNVKVDSIVGEDDLLTMGVWNNATGGWCKTRPGGSDNATVTYKASGLSVAFNQKLIEFYWNGEDSIEFRATRLTSDTAAVVWVDQVVLRSAFSDVIGNAKAPIGARVTVEAATAVTINISVHLVIAAGYDETTVKAAMEAKIAEYIRGRAFLEDNDILYTRIEAAILDTPGVYDYSALLVNTGDANILVGVQAVAVMGTVTYT
jgi:uncharacterized phage protein gp47/JayE